MIASTATKLRMDDESGESARLIIQSLCVGNVPYTLLLQFPGNVLLLAPTADKLSPRVPCRQQTPDAPLLELLQWYSSFADGCPLPPTPPAYFVRCYKPALGPF